MENKDLLSNDDKTKKPEPVLEPAAGNLPKLENEKSIGSSKSLNALMVVPLKKIYKLMVKSRKEEIEHNEQIKNFQKEEDLEEGKKHKLLLDTLTGEPGKPIKGVPPAPPKKEKKKKDTSIITGLIAAGVVTAAVEDKTKEEQAAKAGTPTEPSGKPQKEAKEIKPVPSPAPAEPKVPAEKKPPTEKAEKAPAPAAGEGAGVPAKKAEKFKPAPPGPGFNQGKKSMLDAMDSKGIKDPVQRAQILAQTAHESGGFKYTQELGNEKYFQKYEGRKDLGNTNPGDGLKYIGRGFLQTTGKTNYQQFKDAFNIDVIGSPEKLAEPENAAKSALFWFEKNAKKVQRLSNGDWNNTDAVTKAVNGGYNGLAERKHYFEMFMNDPTVTKGQKATAESPKTGQTISTVSQDNKDMKDQIQRDKTAQAANVNKTTNVTQNQQSEQQKQEAVDDRPAYLKKAVA